ncbi:hypothetical protein ACP4OV_000070 [Aristida adscensionis]
MASPPKGLAPELLAVTSVRNLRQYEAAYQAQESWWPLEFEVIDKLALKFGPRMWGAVAAHEKDWRWVNPETIVQKEKAFDFIHARVVHLLRIRDAINLQVESIRSKVAKLDDDLQEGLPRDAPDGYKPWRLNGPQRSTSIHLRLIDHVDARDVSANIQQQAVEMGVCDGVLTTSYWEVDRAWGRERKATRAFKDFNKEFLSIKLQALEALRDRLVNGAKQIVHSYIRGRTYLGCAPIDFTEHFLDWDPEFLSTIFTDAGGEDAVMDDEMLDYGGDDEDERPLEGDALRIYNFFNP